MKKAKKKVTKKVIKKVVKKAKAKPKAKKKTYRFQLHLGDWSHDGHNQFETYVFESSHPVKKLQQAYKDSCHTVGIQFNHNANYTGLNAHNGYNSPFHVWTDYQDSQISEEALEKLSNAGLDVSKFSDEYGDFDNEDCVKLILEFVKLSLPKLEVKEASYKRSELKGGEIPHFNGFWNRELNVQMGYGLFF